ncbi:hypothetical protein E2C01_001417 [Portunus trituberculatus]|uniref:Uncharacterized protein n=1 Tax=Portunus trituberculatus TaxID=210409 RepID=A0A5B7CJD1_PORTR|nr:hypothetical protein [Portunus trituberculatus]
MVEESDVTGTHLGGGGPSLYSPPSWRLRRLLRSSRSENLTLPSLGLGPRCWGTIVGRKWANFNYEGLEGSGSKRASEPDQLELDRVTATGIRTVNIGGTVLAPHDSSTHALACLCSSLSTNTPMCSL